MIYILERMEYMSRRDNKGAIGRGDRGRWGKHFVVDGVRANFASSKFELALHVSCPLYFLK